MLALAKLSRNYGRGSVSITEIAQSEMIPKRFLENILLRLKKEGILRSERGKSGGYCLAVPPGDVSIFKIMNIFEGMEMLECMNASDCYECEFCKKAGSCKIRKTFIYVRENIYAILKSTTIKDLE